MIVLLPRHQRGKCQAEVLPAAAAAAAAAVAAFSLYAAGAACLAVFLLVLAFHCR